MDHGIQLNISVNHWIQCHYDGDEIGSTGVVVKWSLPDDCVIGQHF